MPAAGPWVHKEQGCARISSGHPGKPPGASKSSTKPQTMAIALSITSPALPLQSQPNCNGYRKGRVLLGNFPSWDGSGRFIPCSTAVPITEVRHRNLKDQPKGRKGKAWGWCAAPRAIGSTGGGKRDKRERQSGKEKNGKCFHSGQKGNGKWRQNLSHGLGALMLLLLLGCSALSHHPSSAHQPPPMHPQPCN